MTDQEPKDLPETDLDAVQGGGHVPSHTPEWSNPRPGDPGRAKSYIGETEKNAWKAPAGVTHDKQFEN